MRWGPYNTVQYVNLDVDVITLDHDPPETAGHAAARTLQQELEVMDLHGVQPRMPAARRRVHAAACDGACGGACMAARPRLVHYLPAARRRLDF